MDKKTTEDGWEILELLSWRCGEMHNHQGCPGIYRFWGHVVGKVEVHCTCKKCHPK
jgi:hypothetical protein